MPRLGLLTVTALFHLMTMLNLASAGLDEKVVDDQADKLMLLLSRPREPLNMFNKGKEDYQFVVPEDYKNPLYKKFENPVMDRFGDDENVVRVKKIPVPDLTPMEQLGRREGFSLFIKRHFSLAVQLIRTFMGLETVDDLMSVAAYARDRLNPYLFGYALSVTLLHRNDTKHLPLPPHLQAFPEKFIPTSTLSLATEESSIASSGPRTLTGLFGQLAVELPMGRTASDLEPENKLWYFREDIGLNLAHWNWHLTHPAQGDILLVNKDRRGELFYYFHQQILARYNFERFCNNLPRTRKLSNWRSPMEEGYFPKLDTLVASKIWPPRFANVKLSDIARPDDGVNFKLVDLERSRDRILEGIRGGYVYTPKRKSIALNNVRGVNILGNLIEATSLSVNRNYYGNLHNYGHLAIAFCHDPDNRFLESFGVMGDSATSMRDPVFYRWHAFINGIFVEHKNSLPPYTDQQLSFPDVKVSWVEVNTRGDLKNQLVTYMQQVDVDISGGLDFTPRGPMPVRTTHLQHVPFIYRIRVENRGEQRIGTVRIFLAPVQGERSLPLSFDDQRHFWIEMDRFIATIRVGNRTLLRRSSESSVTIPLDRMLSSVGKGTPQHCGCGWPHHLLVPKGSSQGVAAQLFVMISDYTVDKVNQPDVSKNGCAESPTYCGVREARYPDRRPMGFPFDRKVPPGVRTLHDFLVPNMALTHLKLLFKNVTHTLKTESLAVDDW